MAGKFAFGTSFSVTVSSVLTPIASLTSITGLDLSADDIDVTAHDSADGYREFVQGLRDGGTVSIEGNFTGVASQEALKTLFDSGEVVAMEIGFPDAFAEWQFNGYVNALSTDAPMDDKASFSATIKVSGKPILSIGS
jgi:predicted secreted protein